MSIPSSKDDTRVQYQKLVLFYGVWQSCLNCKNWQANVPGATPGIPDRCMKFNILPPLEVIVMSCREWLQSIPF